MADQDKTEDQEAETVETEEVEEQEEQTDVEPWMEVEGDDEQETVPVGAISNLRKKLKGKIGERDEEIERLRRENEELKKGAPKLEIPKRPKESDFDTDEEYEKALDSWLEKKETVKFQTLEQRRAQEEQQRRHRESLSKSVEDHYRRAEKLVNDNSIAPDVYRQSDIAVKEATERILPNHGEYAFNRLVDVLGDGSEKVIYYLGRNKTALSEYVALLSEDQQGLKAAAYLGKLSNKLSGTQQKRSRAPAPAPNVDGDSATTPKESALKKKYNEAHKKGKAQEAYNVKKEARAAGYDTKKW